MSVTKNRVYKVILCCTLCVFILATHEAHCTTASSKSQQQEQQVKTNNTNDKNEVSSELPHVPERDEVKSLTQIMFVSCNRHDRSQDYWASMAIAAQCEIAPLSVRESNPLCVAMYHGRVADEQSIQQQQQQQYTSPTDGSNHRVNDTRVVPVGGCGSVLDSPEARHYREEHVRAFMRARNYHIDKDHHKESHNNFNINKKDEELIRGELEKKHKDSTMTQTEKKNSLMSPTIATSERNQQMQHAPLDGFIWLGDAIYADKKMTRHGGMPFGHVKYPLSVIEQMWKTQHAAPEYVAFRESCLTRSVMSEQPEKESKNKEKPNDYTYFSNNSRSNVFGTWDDHDMGANDAGKEYPFKNITQQFLLNFIDAPASDVRWHRPGVYTFHTIPFHDLLQPEHTEQTTNDTVSTKSSSNTNNTNNNNNLIIDALRASYEQAMCLILLDVRSFRDPPNATNSGDMLGEPQWQWLESLLKYNISSIDPVTGKQLCATTYIVNGIQLILDEKISENWAAFPYSRDRLLYLLRTYHAERVSFITGDVHMGELGLDTSAFTVEHVLGYPFVEATSSGLTHSVGDFPFASLHIHRIFHTWRRVGVYSQQNFASARLDFNTRLIAEHRTSLLSALHKVREAQVEMENLKQQHEQEHESGNRTKNPIMTSSSINTNKDDITTSLNAIHEAVSALRSTVNKLVNVTFTVYAIPKAGAPVLRLTFPLSMLTYNESHKYRQSSADKETGFVHLHSPSSSSLSPSQSRTSFVLNENNFANVPISESNGSISLHRIVHYPNTEPVPFVTALSRFMQRHVFTTRSVTASAIATLELCVGFTCLLLVLCVCLCCSCSDDQNGWFYSCCCCGGCFRRCFRKKADLYQREASHNNGNNKNKLEHVTYNDIKRKIAEQKKQTALQRSGKSNKYHTKDVIITSVDAPKGNNNPTTTKTSNACVVTSDDLSHNVLGTVLTSGNSKMNLRTSTSNTQSISQTSDTSSTTLNNTSGGSCGNKNNISLAAQNVATQQPTEAKKEV